MHTAAAAPADGSNPAPGARPRNPWVVAGTVTLATFMAMLDSSIANVALPYIAGSLAASVDESTWMLSCFMVANAITIPLAGWLAAVCGRKRYYMACVLLFTVSSALCGAAPSLGWLLAFRVLQGLGGGGLRPSEQGILLDTFPPAKLGMAMSVYSMAVLVGPIVGPILGGWITENYSWRWIFYINIPFGCLSLLLAHRILEDPPRLVAERASRRGQPLRADLVGIGLIVVGLGALEVVFDRGQEDDWFGSPLIVRLTAVGLVALIGAIIWELRHPVPLLNLRLLKDRNFLCSSILSVVTALTFYGSTICLPEMLQTLFGYTPTQAGLVLSPGAIVTMIEMPIIGFLLGRRLDARWLIAGGLILAATGSLWMSNLNLDVSPGQIVLPRCVQMAGMGMVYVPMFTAAYMYVPKEQRDNATCLFILIRSEAAGLGIALATTMLARRSQFHRSRLVEHIDPADPATAERLEQMARVAADAGFDAATAAEKGIGMLGRLVGDQAMSLTYFDMYRVFGLACLAVLPAVLLMRRSVADQATSVVD